MGQAQSVPPRQNKELFRSDSTLEFDPGKKSKTEAANSKPIPITQEGLDLDKLEDIEAEYNEGLQHVHDDGGSGYIPTSDEAVKRKMRVPVVFRWEYGGKEVYISGSFNEWKTRVPMMFSGGEFTAIIELGAGEHEFKYLVDGHWIHDPNQKTTNDTYGGCNNHIVVSESDFDVTEALKADECDSQHADTTAPTHRSGSATSIDRASPPGSYTNLIPARTSNSSAMECVSPTSVPPTLPPHLLNVILNKECNDEEDPALLPLPNHVGLNHLYALSIKDSVMTMSATHRYKRKYVTTLFYKPIKVN